MPSKNQGALLALGSGELGIRVWEAKSAMAAARGFYHRLSPRTPALFDWPQSPGVWLGGCSSGFALLQFSSILYTRSKLSRPRKIKQDILYWSIKQDILYWSKLSSPRKIKQDILYWSQNMRIRPQLMQFQSWLAEAGVSGKDFFAPGNGKGNWKSHSRFTGREREFANCYGKGREIWGL